MIRLPPVLRAFESPVLGPFPPVQALPPVRHFLATLTYGSIARSFTRFETRRQDHPERKSGGNRRLWEGRRRGARPTTFQFLGQRGLAVIPNEKAAAVPLLSHRLPKDPQMDSSVQWIAPDPEWARSGPKQSAHRTSTSTTTNIG